MVSAFLQGEDVNVFVLDWNAVATNAGDAGGYPNTIRLIFMLGERQIICKEETNLS